MADIDRPLVDKFKEYLDDGIIVKNLPDCILRNLNPKYNLRYYQVEALAASVYYMETYKKRKYPVNLLFVMATGSGKTLIMAAEILYFYSRGYRNFLFMVNSTNILEKTKDNFMQSGSSKYLFSDRIIIDGKTVTIREVDNFDEADGSEDSINIRFLSVQGLFSEARDTRENGLSLEDLQNQKIVIISDEAHHINAGTKKGKTSSQSVQSQPEQPDFFGVVHADRTDMNASEIQEATTWEDVVLKTLNANIENVLLEFTATMDFSNKNVADKYKDKEIYRYNFLRYRNDKFSKSVQLVRFDVEQMDRALLAVLLNEYKLKIANKHNLDLKPVVLFKSKTQIDNKVFFTDFQEMIDDLSPDDLNRLRELIKNKNTLFDKVFNFFEAEQISDDSLIAEIKLSFGEKNLILIDSANKSEDKQTELNNLEHNDYRGVFNVQMLTEGWDVLNLFDIVRLYDTRDSRAGQSGKSTIAEAQLIGRGARYCPFDYSDFDKYKRKFDDDPDNELRILEELHFHSYSESRYISELEKELVNQGITSGFHEQKESKLRADFKESAFYKDGLIYKNKKVKNDKPAFATLDGLRAIANNIYWHSDALYSGNCNESELLSQDLQLENTPGEMETGSAVSLMKLGLSVVRTALDLNSFYRFNNLKKYFNKLTSINEFLNSEDFLQCVKFNLKNFKKGGDVSALPQKEKLRLARNAVNKLAEIIPKEITEYKGTAEFYPHSVKELITDKKHDFYSKQYDEVKITNYQVSHDIMYLTSEEKSFVTEFMQNINKRFIDLENYVLVRNDNFVKFYNYDNGFGFEPDFLLLLKRKGKNKPEMYNIWFEPKGNQFKDSTAGFQYGGEGWKEEFLLSLKDKRLISMSEAKGNVLANCYDQERKYNFKMLGTPLYNQQAENSTRTIEKKLEEEGIIDKEETKGQIEIDIK